VATGVVFGLAPAWQTTRPVLAQVLKEGGRTSGAGLSHHRLRSLLVVGEVALALLLLAGAGLCIKGFQRAQAIDPGFQPQGVLAAALRLGAHGYTEQSGMVFYRTLRQRLASLPGVESAACVSFLPLGFEGGPSRGVSVEGYQPRPNEHMGVPYSIVSPGYFQTLRIPILEGRDFADRDDANAERVVVINQTMAQRFWPGQSPIGRKVQAGLGTPATVIGVVKSGKYRYLSEPPQCFMYLSDQQGAWDLNLGVVVRTSLKPEAMSATLRQEVRALDPGVELWATLPLPDYVQAAYLVPRIAARLLLLLGAIALVLAAMGIYGVMAYVVSQRTHEVGVRLALGAPANHVLGIIVGHGMALAAGGMALGLAGGLVLSRSLASLLYGVSPFDPLTFAAVALVLGLVSLVACYFPARRAAGVDPLVALRYE
jgi:predicted permease